MTTRPMFRSAFTPHSAFVCRGIPSCEVIGRYVIAYTEVVERLEQLQAERDQLMAVCEMLQTELLRRPRVS